MMSRFHKLGDVRGAAFVEALVIIPLLGLIWILARYTHNLNRTDSWLQRRARTCTFAHAVSGCQTYATGACGTTRSLGPVSDEKLRAASRQGFARIARELSFLAPVLLEPSWLGSHHSKAAVTVETFSLLRPNVLRGRREVSGAHAMVCDTPQAARLVQARRWTVDSVFKGTCDAFGRWCP